MGRKGGGGRKMAVAAAAAAAAAVVAAAAAAALTAGRGGGGGGLRRRATSTAGYGFPALLVAAALGLLQVSALDIYTPGELSVENGTEAKLRCMFASSEVINSAASVTWSFQAKGSDTSVSFFYYSNGKSYPGKSTHFKDRITWAGDLNREDASISIANMQFQDNGTYICDVKNPPDIEVNPGEIQVRVVEKVIPPAETEGADERPVTCNNEPLTILEHTLRIAIRKEIMAIMGPFEARLSSKLLILQRKLERIEHHLEL